MNAKDFALRHGEKIVIPLVLLLCAWAMYDVTTDPDIRPKDVTSETITDRLSTIENKRQTSKPPTMKAPPPYEEEVAARWKNLLSYEPVIAWISTTIDVGPTDRDELNFHVYNVLAPKISVHDAVGSMELTITLPKPITSADPRISSERNKTWVNDKQEGHLTNSADQVGLLIEEQVGGEGWKPLKAKDVNADGFLPISKVGAGDADSKGGEVLVVETTDPWVRHAFRARLVVTATGYPFAATSPGVIPEQTILVHSGPWGDDAVDWDDLRKKIGGDRPDPEVANKFMAGTTTPPNGVKLPDGQRVYLGDFGDQAIITPSSDIRFVLWKIKSGENGDEAEFLVNKLVRDGHGKSAWLKTPATKSLKIGDHLVFDAQCLDPNRDNELKINITFETPFALSAINREVNRIEYYEIKPKSRPGVARAKDLDIKPKTHATDVVVLIGRNGQQMILPKLIKIDRPVIPGIKIFPYFPAGYDENAEFLKSPQDFQQWPLEPPKPTEFAKDTGPLEKARVAVGDPLLATDTSYYELTDGRLVYWENVNLKMDVYVEPGSEAEQRKFEAEDAHKAAEKPAGEDPAKPKHEHGQDQHVHKDPPALPPIAPQPAPQAPTPQPPAPRN